MTFNICKFAKDMKSYEILYDDVPIDYIDYAVQYVLNNRNDYRELIFCIPSSPNINISNSTSYIMSEYVSDRGVVKLMDYGGDNI